jgi:hypothetical protein
MRRIWALVVVVALGAWVGAQVPLAPLVSPPDVLGALSSLAAPEQLKSQLEPLLLAAMQGGRLTPGVAYAFLTEVRRLAPADQTSALNLLLEALQGKYQLDPLLNEALKGLRLRTPWPAVREVLALRIKLLDATQTTLERHGFALSISLKVSPLSRSQVVVAYPSPQERLVMEVAWAVGDYLIGGGNPGDSEAIASLVRTRLQRLRDRVLPAKEVDPLLALISPSLVQEIMGMALNTERR